MPITKSWTRKLLPGAIALISAQAGAVELEEVVVTAQKRSESLQDVPISVATVSGEKIANSQMHNLQDMSFSMPNVTINEAPFDNNLFIRGIGSGINAGFEKSVGMYLDGVYAGKGQLSRSPFLDVARVEVLKGPQGILFGKNTIAGAITITTESPSDEFEASVDAYYDPQHNDRELTTIISGPLADNLQGRIAINTRETDGFFENVFTGDDVRQRENTVGRIKLAWQPTDGLDVNFKYEHSNFEDEGRQLAIKTAGAGSAFASIVSNSKPSAGAQPEYPTFNDTDVDVAVLTINYDIGENTLTSITAYSAYQAEIGTDVMNTRGRNGPEPDGFAFWVHTDEEFEQVSQELRLVSPAGETFEYIAGGYYETSEFDRDDFIDWPVPNTDFSGLTRSTKLYVLDTDSWAVFAQGTWNVSDTFRVTLGGRYTEEDKELDFIVTSNTVLPPSVLGAFDLPDLGRDDTKFTWTMNAQWDINDDVMAYANVSTGFKAGGFDNSLFRSFGPEENPIDVLAFEPEEVNSIEIGAKTTLADGAAELNISIFRSEYDDLQTSAFDGVAGFTVGNAGSAISQGVELDGRWRLTEGLTVSGSVSFLDATYDDFKNAGCSQFHAKFTNECEGGIRDLSGEPLVFAPDVSANIGIEYVTPLGGNLELRTNLDVMYTDSFFTVQDLDPNTQSDSYSKTNLRIGLASVTGNWEVALVGKNIFDEQTLSYSNDLTFSAQPGRGNTYNQLLDPPRTIGIQGRYRF